MKPRDRADAFDAALRGRHCGDAQMRALATQVDTIFAPSAEVGPDEEFRLGLRESLLVEARTALAPQATAHVGRPAAAPARADDEPRSRRRVARLSAAAIVTLGGVSLVASSAHAVPGDMLYSVKRGVESVELALHRSSDSRGDLRLAQAGERLAEAEALAKADKPNLAIEAIDDFRGQAESGADDLFAHYSSDGDQQSIERITSFAVTSAEALKGLAELLPSSADDSLAAASAAMHRLVEAARQACGECLTVTLVEPPTTLQRSVPAPEQPDAADNRADEPPARPVVPPPSPTPTPAPGPRPPQPSPGPSPAPSNPPPATGPEIPVLTPLLTGLVGDGDEQEGLLPGLLRGILGR